MAFEHKTLQINFTIFLPWRSILPCLKDLLDVETIPLAKFEANTIHFCLTYFIHF